MIQRYHEISSCPVQIQLAPAEGKIRTRLVSPLRLAKGCFMVGNYLGSISICGMVAEMLAILLFEASNITINGKPLDEAAQKKLFGRMFEKLGQERRIALLQVYDLITAEQIALFSLIRDRRNKYLHLYSFDHEQIATDAREVFSATVRLVVELVGLTVTGGRANIKPAILNYLKKVDK